MAAILLVMEKVGILFVMIAVGFICTKIGMLTHPQRHCGNHLVIASDRYALPDRFLVSFGRQRG